MIIPKSILEPFGVLGIPTLSNLHADADAITDKLTEQYHRFLDAVDKDSMDRKHEMVMAVLKYRLENTAEANGAQDVLISNARGWGRNAVWVTFKVNGKKSSYSHVMTDY